MNHFFNLCKSKHFTLQYYCLIIIGILFGSCSIQKPLPDNDLLRLSTTENLDKYGEFLWTKNDRNIIIHKEAFDKITKNGKRDALYFKSLLKYCHFLMGSNYTPKNITFAQRSFILAHLIDFAYVYQKTLTAEDKFKKDSFVLGIIYSNKNDDFYREFTKNNYYGLFEFKKNHQKEYRPSLQKTMLKINTPKLKDPQFTTGVKNKV